MKFKDKCKSIFFSSDRDRTFSHVLIFFFVMVLLTLIARGTAGAKLARVTLDSPSSGELSRSMRVTKHF